MFLPLISILHLLLSLAAAGLNSASAIPHPTAIISFFIAFLLSLTIGIGTGNTSTLATFHADSCKWFHGVTLSIAETEDYTIVIREGSALLKTALNCLEIAA